MFFDYEMVVTAKGEERHVLRVDGQTLPNGRFCIIRREGVGWDRATQWDSKHGRRTFWYAKLDDAMASGIAWVQRRSRDDG